MNQICKQNDPPQGSHIILEEVVIRHDIKQHWFEALGQFALLLRFQRGLNHVIQIKNDEGFVNSAGELVISAKVSSETLQMAVPAESWEWKDNAISAG